MSVEIISVNSLVIMVSASCQTTLDIVVHAM